MKPHDDPDQLPGAGQRLGALLAAGRVQETIDGADAVMRDSIDVQERAVVSVQRMNALLEPGRPKGSEYRAAEDEAWDAVTRAESLSAIGGFHAWAALGAYRDGEWDDALGHLLDSEQALGAETSPTLSTALNWRALAFTQSGLGLHEKSVASMAACEGYADRWPLLSNNLGPRLNAALVLDHTGDTEGCVRDLEEVCRIVRAAEAEEDCTLSYWDTLNAAYAAARLQALGGDPGVDPRRFLPAINNPSLREPFRRRVLACVAIAEGRPEAPLEYFDSIPVEHDTRPAEIFRLRSIAHGAVGDHTGALAAERQGFRVVSEQMVRAQRALAARSGQAPDHAALRLSLANYAFEALTDPLTGLPNRRHLDQRLEEIVGSGRPAALGVLDLDRFKQVNTVHGHVGGDQVLRRIAAILLAAFRAEDFVARYGGDEFVVLLPGRTVGEAHVIGRRVAAAVAGAAWDDIAPGTPVGASIGWTDIGAHPTAAEAIAAADREMYAEKRS